MIILPKTRWLIFTLPCGISGFNLLSFYMHMAKFYLANTIQPKAMLLNPWLRAGSWHLDHKPVKLFLVLNDLCNPVMQRMTF